MIADVVGVMAGFTAADGAGVTVVDRGGSHGSGWDVSRGLRVVGAGGRRPISGEPPRSSLSLLPPFPSHSRVSTSMSQMDG